jgi:hypothetical protein
VSRTQNPAGLRRAARLRLAPLKFVELDELVLERATATTDEFLDP